MTSSAFQLLSPHPVHREAPLEGIERALGSPELAARLDASEREGVYPDEVLARLDALGVAECFAGRDAATPYHVAALAETLARRSGSLAITVAVNALALLPAYVAASPARLDALLERVRGGARAAILMTELAHGSDLLATETRATLGVLDAARGFTPAPAERATHARLDGEKQLINGGSRHEILFVLARTVRAEAASASVGAGDLSVFEVTRDPSVVSLPAWRTLPADGADISGARFEGTVVPLDAVVGELGDGITVLHRTLAMSRGGVSALAAGVASAARALAVEHSQTRRLYGAPIAALGAIREHLARAHALELTTAALSVKQAAMVNGLGPGASHHAAAAKLACCALAEDAVVEGRRVLGARALLRAHPFERLVRDVTLYGVFDGTSHVVLEQLQLRLAQLSMRSSEEVDGEAYLARVGALYRTPPRAFRVVAKMSARAFLVPLDAYLSALAARADARWMEQIAGLARTLLVMTRALRQGDDGGRWEREQAVRHAAAEQLAWIEALTALAELGDPRGRAALGLPALSLSAAAQEHHRDAVVYAALLLGARVAGGLRWLARLGLLEGAPHTRALDEVERVLGAEAAGARERLHQRLGPHQRLGARQRLAARRESDPASNDHER